MARGPPRHASPAVAVSFGNKIAWAGSLDLALNDLFEGNAGASAGDTGTNTPTTPGTGGAGGTPTPTPTGTSTPGPTTSQPTPTGTPDAAALAQAIKDAQAAYTEGEAALKRGDFAAYGQAQARLEQALQRAAAAAPQGSATKTP